NRRTHPAPSRPGRSEISSYPGRGGDRRISFALGQYSSLATGTVSFRGKLHLSSRLAINEKIRAQLYKPIRANFQPTEEPGYSAVDFEVSGTVERPKTNLLEKVVGRDLKDLVNSFLGGKSDQPK